MYCFSVFRILPDFFPLPTSSFVLPIMTFDRALLHVLCHLLILHHFHMRAHPGEQNTAGLLHHWIKMLDSCSVIRCTNQQGDKPGLCFYHIPFKKKTLRADCGLVSSDVKPCSRQNTWTENKSSKVNWNKPCPFHFYDFDQCPLVPYVWFSSFWEML